MAGNNNDDLIISISTDLATVKRALNRLVSDVGAASSGIEKRFASTGKSINNSLTTSMQDRINSMVGIGTTAAKEWNGVLADQQKELDRLGDYIQIGDKDLHMVMEPATAGAGGVTSQFEVRPHLWPGVTAPIAATLIKPSCVMTMLPGTVSTTADKDTGRAVITFQAIEAR